MSPIPVLITAKLGSTRLPKKHLLDLGGTPVIEHVVRRCTHFGFEPFICCPESDANMFSAMTSCLNVFGSSMQGVEAQVIDTANHYNIRFFHQIDGDDPFFDRDAVIDSIQCFRKAKFSRVLPSIYSQSGPGLVGTSYNLDAKENLVEELPDPAHIVWPMRLTLDYEEDYHLICAVNRMAGGFMAPRKAIDDLFIRNPDLHRINFFRNDKWKIRQLGEFKR